MQNADFRFQISDFRVPSWNLELGTWNSRLGRARPAVTIIEVLFSILVTTVGLFGAIAIFPVASARARHARLNDAIAAAGRSAVHDFDTRGMRRPDRWYIWNTSTSQFNLVTFPPPPAAMGQSYCIDSRSVVYNANTTSWPNAQFFPYTPSNTTMFGSPAAQMLRVAFFPGKLDPAGTIAKDQFDRRNLASPPRNRLLADSIFLLEDDLVFLRPGIDDVSRLGLNNDRSLPAMQRFDYDGTLALKRQSLGHLSWMATLVPRVDFATGLASDDYMLSIVMFNDRPTDLQVTAYASGGNENLLERTVSALIQSDGSTGGEFLLYCPAANISAAIAAERLKLRANNWVMLSGTQNTGGGTVVSRFQWYRVTQCDNEVSFAAADGILGFDRYQIYATLVGPDWNTNLASLQATLVEGAVGVYEKTVRLDSSSTF